FFQAEDGIRDFHVTGVQTCALPIYGLRDLHRRKTRIGISSHHLGGRQIVKGLCHRASGLSGGEQAGCTTIKPSPPRTRGSYSRDTEEPACMVEGLGWRAWKFRLLAQTDWQRLPPPRLPASIRN